MQKKFFAVPHTATGNPSGNAQLTAYTNRADAELGATATLNKQPNVHTVHIVETVAVAERQKSPIKVTEVNNFDLSDTEASLAQAAE